MGRRKFFIIALLVAQLYSIVSFAQTTNYPTVRSKNNNCSIESVTLTNTQTIVKIRVPSSYKSAKISSGTVIMPSDRWDISLARQARLGPVPTPTTWNDVIYRAYQDAIKRVQEGRQVLRDEGFLIRSLGNDKLDQGYHASSGSSSFVFTLYFDRLPVGVEDFYIRELEADGWEWVGIKINNPYPTVQNIGLSEYTIKSRIDEVDDGIVGIYEQVGDQKYKLGCVLDNDTYKLVYLGSGESYRHWRVGDVKAILRNTATPGLFKADWRMLDKTLNTDTYVTFDGVSMKTVISTDSGAENDTYIKMYPTGSSGGINPGKSSEWSGSGFALKDGFIVTNYHVIDGAKTILVLGVGGGFGTEYKASVVATDKSNDLALVKIDDYRFNGFGSISYSIKTGMADVGEDVFVLGYPLTTVMGDEIKLTTGVISSRTGFQGDVSSYQISAPIQPGNSGGPLFDSKGNLIGIVNAKISAAENVGYAIKASYLKNLVESYTSSSILPSSNTVSSLSRPNQIKSLKNFVFLIKCSSIASGTSSSSSSSRSIGNNSPSSNSSSSLDRGSGQSSSGSSTSTINMAPNRQVDDSGITITNLTNAKADGTQLRITKIRIQDSQTIIDFECGNAKPEGGYYEYIQIEKSAVIVVDGKTYQMTKVGGIKISPEKSYFTRPNETLSFKLYFPPINKSARSLDFVESPTSKWQIRNIKLQ